MNTPLVTEMLDALEVHGWNFALLSHKHLEIFKNVRPRYIKFADDFQQTMYKLTRKRYNRAVQKLHKRQASVQNSLPQTSVNTTDGVDVVTDPEQIKRLMKHKPAETTLRQDKLALNHYKHCLAIQHMRARHSDIPMSTQFN